MIKNIIHITLAVYALTVVQAYGIAVDENHVRIAADNWLMSGHAFVVKKKTVETVKPLAECNGRLWYIALQPKGYLVMSSDDKLPPVVAFDMDSEPDTVMPIALQKLLQRHSEIFTAELTAVSKTRGDELATANRLRWQALLSPTRAVSQIPSEIIRQPMLTTLWHQDAPYNMFCLDGSVYSHPAAVGCVPLAVAQVMAFHQWPSSGVGSSSFSDAWGTIRGTLQADFSVPYDWANIADTCEDTTSASSRAVARLAAECGVLSAKDTPDFDYEVEETVGYAYLIYQQLATCCRYSPDAVYGYTVNGQTDKATLYARIRTDMVEGRPALVEIGEHEFVADGLGILDGLDYYHFNYGWGGNKNGWYLLTDGYEGSVINGATTGIKPSPQAVFKPLATQQRASFELAWDFPKTIDVTAFRLKSISKSTHRTTVISSNIDGTARRYALSNQSGTNTYTLEAQVDGVWQNASDGVTITVNENAPQKALTVTMPDIVQSIENAPAVLTVSANRTLKSVSAMCSRPDVVKDIAVNGSGASRTVTLTPVGSVYCNVIVYVEATDTYGMQLKQAVTLNVMPDMTKPRQISCTVSSSGKGSVVGLGDYHYGQECCLGAVPSIGYRFVSWQLNGVTVSEENPYCFAVTGDATYKAVFDKYPCPVTVKASSADHGEVSGGNTYLYGDTCILSATAKSGFRFVKWVQGGADVSTQNPYRFTVDAAGAYTAVFEPEGGQSAETRTQTLRLSAGWNWIGFSVLPKERAVSAVFGQGSFSQNDRIQSATGQATYTDGRWVPSSMELSFGVMYQVYVAKATDVTVTGFPCTDNTLSLSAGWNWLASPVSGTVAVTDLVYTGGFSVNDCIQSASSCVGYTGRGWLPSKGLVMEAGKGYQAYVAQAGLLTFPLSDSEDSLYAVIDLSGGPEAQSYPVRYSAVGPDVTDDTCRTTELWLRRIPAGRFFMGSPEYEIGRPVGRLEMLHEVTLTQDVYMGVFECTQRQWELVMGSNPSSFNNSMDAAMRPVESVSCADIRGSDELGTACWPQDGHYVGTSSFMRKLQKKTGLVCDLPTEAVWEYACRAGTVTAVNTSCNLLQNESDAAMTEVARYGVVNEGDATVKVGMYKPNAWGLYDMHGNVSEWCLDRWNDALQSENAKAMSDPAGSMTGYARVIRGGSLYDTAASCRSASRSWQRFETGTDSIGFRVTVWPKDWDRYLVVDLSDGSKAETYPVRYTSSAPDITDDTCRTTELWLRKIPTGTFVMGSPASERGRSSTEMQHEVTLSQSAYIGIFECTQKQWKLVKGNNGSKYKDDCRPVETVTFNGVRGTSTATGVNWPLYGHVVSASSFMGTLQAKVGLAFDLPTEALWEYACRAGTATALNSGKNLTSSNTDAAMSEVGRYSGNQNDGLGGFTEGHTKVGSYLPNVWGLYDMHGNVREWCLDWYGTYDTDDSVDPAGGESGEKRVLRGGHWNSAASACRSAARSNYLPSGTSSNIGFRVAVYTLLP